VLRADFNHVSEDAALWPRGDLGADEQRDALVRDAVARHLTARQREIVEWHFFEGLSQGAIARRLGVTQQVVQKALYGDTRRGRPVGGALRRLREALTPTLAASP
jgi:DNA-directed RNA polymerase specialized sigma24 family protein